MSLFDSRFIPQRYRMSRAERTRQLLATPSALWEVIADPFQMPRWWPNVTRVEGVQEGRFTLVFQTKRKRPVRMDFHVLASDAPGTGGEASGHRAWEQEVVGTPFERVLDSSITEILLDPARGGTTQVTIVQAQKLRGYSRTGALMLRGATNKRLDEALEALARIVA
ncbi:MAG: SRPBCC family protein [Solirubrobacterales bacterium]|nr:SRPBCC family protein [Solirubrobacterales bacterium]